MRGERKSLKYRNYEMERMNDFSERENLRGLFLFVIQNYFILKNLKLHLTIIFEVFVKFFESSLYCYNTRFNYNFSYISFI